MRAHPEGVRSVTIDSVLPTDVSGGAADASAAFERVKRVFFDGCAKDERCHAAFPDLEADTNALTGALDASPHHSTIENPTLHRQTPIVITGADASAGLFDAFYNTDLIPQLPGIIEQLKAGTAGAIIDQLAIRGIDFVNGAAEVQTAAVDCYDRANLARPDDDARALRDHPDSSTLLLFGAVKCADFGVTAAPKSFNEPVRSDIPTLVLGDEYDPVTPPEQSQHASESLSHSTFVKFPGLGHGAVFAGPECPKVIFRAFLADPATKPDTSCVASMGPPKWAVPS
jgi:pimeloyl-ACP methyl ester carboxylesterase